MFEYLALFSRIVVTGPQRSGTHICAVMIADDLGYTFCEEVQIDTYKLDLMKHLFDTESRFVLQAPGICRHVHEFSAPDVAIILMRRAVSDIIASEKRVGWFGSIHRQWELERYGLTKGNIAEVKYQYWDDVQRELIHNPFEIEYESLVAHPMWIPQEERINFRSKQYKRE